jgi:hypothetical protein
MTHYSRRASHRNVKQGKWRLATTTTGTNGRAKTPEALSNLKDIQILSRHTRVCFYDTHTTKDKMSVSLESQGRRAPRCLSTDLLERAAASGSITVATLCCNSVTTGAREWERRRRQALVQCVCECEACMTLSFARCFSIPSSYTSTELVSQVIEGRQKGRKEESHTPVVADSKSNF